MYTQFFGLTEKPFSITPDPHFLFMSERHAEALAHLVYGVTESGGFIQLTGEVGTGKTTLTRSLLERLPETVDLAAILNPRLTVAEFLCAIFDELGVARPESTSTRDLVEALNQHLLFAHEQGRKTVLLVDEAQNLDADVLEQLRLLTNLETAKQKLLQIILVGQPELRTLLARTDLRQLAQRITGRYHLEALNARETIAYVKHRMAVAGATTQVFTSGALWEVHRAAGGIPRLTNVICDRALLGAFSSESHTVTRAIVRRAAAEVQGAPGRKPRGDRERGAYWLWAVTLAAVAFGLWGLLGGKTQEHQSVAAANDETKPAAASVETADTPQKTVDIPLTLRELRVSNRLTPLPDTKPRTPPQPATAAMADLLADGRYETGTDTAFAELFARWGAVLKNGQPPCTQAQSDGLRCAFQVGSLRLLRTMNRPAILSLVDTDGDSHNTVVVSIDAKTMTLRFGNREERVAIDDVMQYWFGEFLVLWRPLHGDLDLLLPGTRNPAVGWLRTALADVLSITAPTDDPLYFDNALRRQLQTFQRTRRLEADGKAGVQTMIAINSARALPGTPYLEAP